MTSKRLANIKPSATLAISAKAKQLKKEGKDIVIFGAGEPDFETPLNIREAAKKAIDENFSKYTPVGGIPELRKAVADKFKKGNNIDYDPSEILIGCGGKHILFNAIMALIDKGDEVIIPKPYWLSYLDMVNIAEGKPVICGTDKRFKLKAEDVEKNITDNTKLLILNSPSNPSGAVVDNKEIIKISELAVSNNFYVISDEVYEHFIFNGDKNISIASLNEEIKEKTLTVNAVSKTYAMTGWRIGYCAARKEIVKAMETLQSQSTSNPTGIAQKAALEALTGPQDSIPKMIKAFDERRKFMYKRLNQIKGIQCNEPEGAFYAFPDISGTGFSSMDFTSKLLDEALVAVVPGLPFGSDKHIRLSYATSMEEIEKGLSRIEKWVDTNST